MSVTSASNLCFLSGRPLISIWTNVHKVRRLWLVTDIHAYIAEFHADIADVCADIAENLADVRNFSQCPLHVRRVSADIWDTGLTLILSEILHLQCLKYKKRAITQKLLQNFFSKISPNTSLIIPFQLTQVSSFYL